MARRSHSWNDPRVKPPFGAAQLNRTHPLAQGLRGYYLCQGSGPVLGANLAGSNLTTVTAKPTSRARGRGEGFSGDGSAAIASAVVPFTGFPFSMVAGAEWDGTGGYVVICGFGNPGATQYHLMGVNASNALVFEDNAVGVNLTMNASPPVNVPFTCGRSSAATNAHRAFYNGKFVTNSTTDDPGSMATVTNYTLNAVWYSGGAPLHFWKGLTYWNAIWARALSDGEMQWLHAEPYIMLEPIVKRRYFVPAAAGSTVPPKFHHYMGMH